MPISALAYRVMAFAGLVALAIMVGTTLLAVIARYFGVLGFEWSYEVAAIAFLWVTFLGTVLAEAQGHNAAFGILRDAAPPRIRVMASLSGRPRAPRHRRHAARQRHRHAPSHGLCAVSAAALPGFVPRHRRAASLGLSLCIMALRRLILRHRA